MQILLEFGIQNLKSVNVESASSTIMFFSLPIHCNLMDLIIKFTVSNVENFAEKPQV